MSAVADTLKAIRDRWNTKPALQAAIPGGVHEGQVPVGSVKDAANLPQPYCQVEVTQGPTPNQYFAGYSEPAAEYIDCRKVSFAIYAVGTERIGECIRQLRAVFDPRPLATAGLGIPNATFLMSRFLGESLPAETMQQAGEDVRKATVDYEFCTQRTQ